MFDNLTQGNMCVANYDRELLILECHNYVLTKTSKVEAFIWWLNPILKSWVDNVSFTNFNQDVNIAYKQKDNLGLSNAHA